MRSETDLTDKKSLMSSELTKGKTMLEIAKNDLQESSCR